LPSIRGLLRVSKRAVIVEHVGETLGGTPGANKLKEVLAAVSEEPDIPFDLFCEKTLSFAVADAAYEPRYAVEGHLLRRSPVPSPDELLKGAHGFMLNMVLSYAALKEEMLEAIRLLEADKAESVRRAATSKAPLDIHMPDLMARTITDQLA